MTTTTTTTAPRPKHVVLKDALKNWHQLCTNQRKMECMLLELLRHPDATAEQIVDAATRYRESHARIVETRRTMYDAVKKYGSHFDELQFDSYKLSVTQKEA